jgi:hypothetical protein
MKAIRTTVVFSLLLTLAGATSLTVRADDEPATPATPAAPAKPAPSAPGAPKKPIHQRLSGRVVSVDKYARTITLQVENLTYVLQITDSTRVSRSGEEKTLTDVVVGWEISVNVVLREMANGRVEVAVLSVELPETIAGQGYTPIATNRAPFQNGPNPGNVDGPIVSPHR